MVLIYMILWLILIGEISASSILLGLIISPAADLFVRAVLHAPYISPRCVILLMPLACVCLGALLMKAAASALDMARILISGTLEIEPCIVEVPTDLHSPMARSALSVLLALGFGAAPVAVRNDAVLVHMLHRDDARGLINAPFERILRKMEDVIANA